MFSFSVQNFKDIYDHRRVRKPENIHYLEGGTSESSHFCLKTSFIINYPDYCILIHLLLQLYAAGHDIYALMQILNIKGNLSKSVDAAGIVFFSK